MAIADDIRVERAKLIKVTFGNKLAKKVTAEILMPILNELENQYPYILNEVGSWLTMRIKDYMMSFAGTGRTYMIYEYNPDAPYGQRKQFIGSYTAGADFGPPVSYNYNDPLLPPTGSLAEGIQYEINDKGYLTIGLLDPNFTTGREFKSYGFYGEDKRKSGLPPHILVGPEADSQPVHHYWEQLNKKRGGAGEMSWFKEMMIDLRSEYREKLRKEAQKALRKITKRTSVRRAIVFKVYFK